MTRFQLDLSAPGIRELSLTSTTLYLEIGRRSLFLNLWDMPTGGPWFDLSSFESGTGWELRLGPAVAMLGKANQPTDHSPLLTQ